MFHCCAAMSVVRDNHTISRKSDAGQVEILSSFSSYANCDTIYSWKGGENHVLSAVITVHSDPVHAGSENKRN